MRTRQVLIWNMVASIALILAAFMLRSGGARVSIMALVFGCVANLANLFFYRRISLTVLDSQSKNGRALSAILLLLKLPITIAALLMLTQQGAVVTLSFIAGFMVLIPATVIGALLSRTEIEKGQNETNP